MPDSTRYKKSSGNFRPQSLIDAISNRFKYTIPDLDKRLALMDVYKPDAYIDLKSDMFDTAYALWANKQYLPVVGYCITGPAANCAVSPCVVLRDIKNPTNMKCVVLGAKQPDTYYLGVPVPDKMFKKGRFVFHSILSDVSLIRKLSPRELEI